MKRNPQNDSGDFSEKPLILDIESSWERISFAAMALCGVGAAIWIGGAVSGNADMMPGWPHSMYAWLVFGGFFLYIRVCLDDRYVLDPRRQVLEWYTRRFSRRREHVASFADVLGVCIKRRYTWDETDEARMDAALFLYLRQGIFLRVSSWKIADPTISMALTFEKLDQLAKDVSRIIGCSYWDRDLKQVKDSATILDIWRACQETSQQKPDLVPAAAYWEWAAGNRGMSTEGPGIIVFTEMVEAIIYLLIPAIASFMFLGATFFGVGSNASLLNVGKSAVLFLLCMAGTCGWMIFLDRFFVPVLPRCTLFDYQRGIVSQFGSLLGRRISEQTRSLSRELTIEVRKGPLHKGSRTWNVLLAPVKSAWLSFTSFCRHESELLESRKIAEKLASLLGLRCSRFPQSTDEEPSMTAVSGYAMTLVIAFPVLFYASVWILLLRR